ncbi:hypothetical protein A9507_09485 [Methanobacterium sp. A39]|uniref:Glycosyl transferase family 1 domain-containing protein n=1 Tax=Methanobacterium bryantii TaxID=2161 RepID=A0A2A2H3L6_METBR|nr:hypothetical protein A9507_09485 [Methanobacterium sp. A39]PAV03955.1 hypothetical protein ASJ80_02760 [Methanobacterium bryantii]
MKILVTSLPDLSKLNPQRPHHLLNHLSKKHEINLFCGNAWWLEDSSDQYLKDTLKDIKIDYFSQKKRNSIIQEILAKKNLDKLNLDLNSFDIHINFNSFIAGYNVAKKIEAPTVFDICDDLIDWISISPQIPYLIKPLGKIIGSSMLKRNINISSQITSSLDILNDLYEIPKNKRNIILNGVDTVHFKNRGGEYIREKLNIPEDTFLLVFVGYLGNWIELEPTFKAIKHLKSKYKIKLLVVGDGDRLNRFKYLSKEFGIESSVMFTGNINYSDVPEYISAADVCLLPFDNSNVSQGALPLKLFEYMSCEKPVISSPLINVKKIVNDHVIFAGNDEIEKNIIELYNDEELRRYLGKKGREFVIKGYSWDFISDKFEKTLIKTIGEN